MAEARTAAGEREPASEGNRPTFLLTDIEGSTRMWEANPDAMSAALARHDELLAEIVGAHGGRLVKTRGEGDSAFAVFADAAGAVRCALELQHALHAEPWPATASLRVRLAMHTGDAETREGDFYGPVVNRCARLRAICHGGQAILSEATASLARAALPGGAELADLGLHRLRDLARPERVFQIVHASIPADFPPLASLDARRHNLPLEVSSFVGREDDLAETAKMLAATRLLTIVGPGGSGKTRLALRAAAEAVDEHPDGVWLAELGSVSDPVLVAQRVAAALGVREERGRPVLATLESHCASRRLLLVLDNCEHLLDACAEISDRLLRSCPNLTILATSREPLGVAGESLFRIPPLPAPDPARRPPFETLAGFAAVKLFAQRAALARAGFALTPANGDAVAEICHRLDGIPLAIELAAARAGALTPTQIAERLGDRFRLLAGARRGRTLRETVDWSHDLLDESERAVFRRAAVLAGGFTLEAAEEICRGGEIERDGVLELLARLVDKSLLVAQERGAELRYSMLETLREYAAEKLRASGEERDTLARHGDFFTALAARAEPELVGGPEQVAWLDRLEEEHDNLRAMLSRSLAPGGDPAAALRLAGLAWRLWSVHGSFGEGRGWLEAALAADAGAEARLRAKALTGAASLAYMQGDYPASRSRGEEALGLWREIGDERGTAASLGTLGTVAYLAGEYPEARVRFSEALGVQRALGDERGIAGSLGNLGNVAFLHGDYAEAGALYEESMEIYRGLGDVRAVALSLNNLASIASRRNDLALARRMHTESLAMRRSLGDRWGEALSLGNLGAILISEGEVDAAREPIEQSLAIRRSLGDRVGVAIALSSLGSIAMQRRELPEARALFEEALALRREIGNRDGVADCLNGLGAVAEVEGDLDASGALHREALAIRRDLGNKEGIGDSFEGMASHAAAAGDHARAARLLGAAEAVRELIGSPLTPGNVPDHDRIVAACSAALGEDGFARGWAEGHDAPPEEAVAWALAERS